MSHITASVVAGPAVKLVNLSRGGALMEVASRFPMRSRVRLKLSVATGEVTVAEGLVAWARVAAIVDKQVNYLVAVIFDKPIPDLGGLDPAPIPESAADVPAPEAPVVLEMPAPRDNVSPFPVPSVRTPEPAVAEPGWADKDEHVVSLDELGEEASAGAAIGQTVEQLAALATVNESLAAQLAAAEATRDALRNEVDAERRMREEERGRLLHEMTVAAASAEALQTALARLEEEHSRTLAEKRDLEAEQSRVGQREQEYAQLVAELAEQRTRYGVLEAALQAREDEHTRITADLADRQARNETLQSSLESHQAQYAALQSSLETQQAQYTTLQSSLETREQEHLHALADQRSGYEALTTELLQAAQDQQAGMQLLMDEQAAMREDVRRQSEQHALELARVQQQAASDRMQLELRCQDLQARLEAAQAQVSAQDARDRTLRRELEKLAAAATLLARGAEPQQQAVA